MTCKDKQENNGTCPHHNLQCGWPKCNEPEQGYVGCIPWQWVDKAKQISDGPIAYPDAERAQQAIALIKILLKSTPPQRTWVGLTNEEVITMSRYDLECAALIGEVHRRLKERNT